MGAVSKSGRLGGLAHEGSHLGASRPAPHGFRNGFSEFGLSSLERKRFTADETTRSNHVTGGTYFDGLAGKEYHDAGTAIVAPRPIHSGNGLPSCRFLERASYIALRTFSK